MMTPEQAKDAAIAAAGGVPAVAKAFRISAQAVWKWKAVPAERVLVLESMAGNRVTRFEMRPDVFGEAAAPQEAA